MHIKEVLIDREIPFTEENGHITITHNYLDLHNKGITNIDNVTMNGNDIVLYANGITSFNNTYFNGRYLDLAPMRSLRNLNGLTYEGRYLTISSNRISGSRYIGLFANVESELIRRGNAH